MKLTMTLGFDTLYGEEEHWGGVTETREEERVEWGLLDVRCLVDNQWQTQREQCNRCI